MKCEPATYWIKTIPHLSKNSKKRKKNPLFQTKKNDVVVESENKERGHKSKEKKGP